MQMWHCAVLDLLLYLHLKMKKQIIVPPALADWWEIVRIPVRIRDAAEINPSLSPH